ncbi:hypothetical protein WICPIJ_003242 [Wickerhamomyces pijperi]|uniref:Dol-P-Man:Man(5)GlcNAc(2)-PP-Dol alpha-1,3-mannosyltransferase n=1 Tax=Wickerhamomyces pijperi TaxID=599730 RepID=A0A9P8QAA5_WICPI|nr:hypothetical protein WICPIJ_003242 [Wickerhamomyces pijperi]
MPSHSSEPVIDPSKDLEPKTETSSAVDQNKPEIPPFTLQNVLNDIISGIHSLIFDPECNKVIIPILLFLESSFTKIIIDRVAYTEIDYTAYMEQISLIQSGELDYENIYGGTGPLVYPAGHVFIYKILSVLTSGTENVGAGQGIFGYLYTFTQCLTFMVFANLELPPWCFYLSCLSKRLHSIYVLRLFNDCFGTLYSLLMVLCFQYGVAYKVQHKQFSAFLTKFMGPLFYSVAISVKMNALLYLPGVLVVLYFTNGENLLEVVPSVIVMVLFQLVIAYPFLTNGPLIRESYFKNAFDFKRKFMFKWTVNWKFVGEEVFNSDQFHKLLLGLHVGVLSLILITKFLQVNQTGKSFTQLVKDGFKIHKSTISPSHIINGCRLQSTNYITLLLVLTNFTGILFARSLHYQFLSWYAWTYPILLSVVFDNNIFGLIGGSVVYLAHEWCWNVYPSDEISSSVMIGLNSLVLVGCLLRLDFADFEGVADEISESKKDK